MAKAYLACAEANDVLSTLPSGSIQLANFSPRYLGKVGYHAAAEEGHDDGAWWSGAGETLADYVREHLQTAGLLHRVLSADSMVGAEVDDVRIPREDVLVPLSDIWRQVLESAGFRILERIVLVRTLAIGRRSGHFKRRGGRPGDFLPDHVTSTLWLAAKGDPRARLRREARPEDLISAAWADRFLRDCWVLPPPRRKTKAGHPCPQHPMVSRVVVSVGSLRGDRVIDVFAGEGTTGVQALTLGRDAVLIEREPAYAAAIARALPVVPEAIHRLGGRLAVPGSQLHLPLGMLHEDAIRAGFLEGSTLETASDRLRRIAALASRMCGVAIPPELAGLLIRAEHSYYADTLRRKRSATELAREIPVADEPRLPLCA